MISPDKLQAFVDKAQYTNSTPILEATFYGKNPELQKIESILDEMVDLGHQGKTTSTKFNDRMYDVSVRLARLFGFTNLQINNSCLCIACPTLLISLNNTAGCTLLHSNVVKYSKFAVKAASGNGMTEYVDFDKSHRGIRFKPDAKYTMRMFLGMELFEDHGENSLTGGEILAVVLHEIGHNFYVGPIREFGAEFLALSNPLDITQWLLQTCLSILTTEGSDIIDQMTSSEFKKANAAVFNAIGTILRPLFAAGQLVSICFSLIMLSVIIAKLIISIPFKLGNSVLRYDTEKYSDAFASSYGYGAELSTGLYKLGHLSFPNLTNKKVQNVLDFLMGMYKIPLSLILTLIDEHPETNGRLLNNIKYMEAAGATITDSKLRKEYAATMDKMYALREETKSYKGSNLIGISNKITSCVQDLLNLSDPKDLATGLRPTLNKYANLDYTT